MIKTIKLKLAYWYINRAWRLIEPYDHQRAVDLVTIGSLIRELERNNNE